MFVVARKTNSLVQDKIVQVVMSGIEEEIRGLQLEEPREVVGLVSQFELNA